jgi:hypothetical protein
VLVRAIGSEGDKLGGLDLFVSDKAGAFVGQAKTDAEGSVRLDVPEGGWVSAYYERPHPGPTDRRRASLRSVRNEGLTEVPFKFTSTPLPAPNPTPMPSLTVNIAGVTTDVPIHVYIGCLGLREAPTGVVELTDYFGCPGRDTFDVFAITEYNGVNYGSLREQPFTPGVAANITVVATIFGSAVTLRSEARGVPAGSKNWSVDWQVSSNLIPSLGFGLFKAEPSSGNITASAILPGDSALFVRGSAYIELPSADPSRSMYAQHFWIATEEEPASSWSTQALMTVDELSPLALDDVRRPSLSWKGSDLGSSGDVTRVSLSYLGDDELRVLWQIDSPPTRAGSLRAPDVGPAFDAFLAGRRLEWHSVDVEDPERIATYAEYVADPGPGFYPATTSGSTRYPDADVRRAARRLPADARALGFGR